MIQNVSCPDRSVYEGFLSGRLDDEQLNEVERHLADCEACGETVRAMRVDDTFLELLQQVGRAAPHAEDESLDPLLQQLEQLNETRGDALTSLAARRREVEALLQPTDDGELGRLGHYVLSRPLGAGGMGIVYQAEDTKLRRSVALKILRPSLGPAAKERFLHEARAAAAIENDNVVTIYDAGNEGGLAFLAMQWLDGETLEHRLQRRERLPANEVTDIAAQIAAGLAAAHEQKLIHRDIKPANIWLEADRDRARLLDFGLARCLDDDILLTETGMIAGTPAYMSPEQAQGRAIDERSDLFSLGTLLYRMLTGHLPFEADNALAVITAIQQHQPAAPRQLDLDIPSWLSDLVMDLLEKDPRDRPQRAADVAQSLRTQRRQYPVQPRQSPVAQSDGGRSPIWRWATAACFGFFAIVATAFVYRIATDRGDIVVRSQDPNVQVEVMQGGKLVRIIDPVKQDRVTLRAGTYELKLGDTDGNFVLDRDKLTLVRDGVEVITVEVTKSLASPKGAPVIAQVPTWETPPREFARQLTAALTKIRASIGEQIATAETVVDQWEVRREEADELLAEAADEPEEQLAEGKRMNAEFNLDVCSYKLAALRKQLAVLDQSPANTQKVLAGRPIHINVAGTIPDAPIDGDYWVEPSSGAVPLGPLYGRVFVAGMTLEQAELAIQEQLRGVLGDPMVQVTASRSSQYASPQPSGPFTMVYPSVPAEETVSGESIRVVDVKGNHAT
ncbi:MAG: protein kinase, partial [Planctomycetota bacterium]